MGIAAMRHLLVHTITREPWTGQDKFTKPTFGAKETYKARVEGKTTLVRTAQGQEKQSTRRVFVDTGQGASAVIFDVKDRITLPVQFWPAAAKPPAILDVQPRIGTNGVDHLEVFL